MTKPQINLSHSTVARHMAGGFREADRHLLHQSANVLASHDVKRACCRTLHLSQRTFFE